MSATVAPSRAAVSTSRSRPVSGLVPAASVCAASAGSTTRSPRATRRTASASCSAGASLTTNPNAPDSIARRRKPGRPNVVTISTRVCGASVAQHRRGSQAVQSGHLHVEQDDVGTKLAHPLQHLVTTTDFAHHLEVFLERQQSGQRTAYEVLVVSEQDPDHSGHHYPRFRWARQQAGRHCRFPSGRLTAGATPVSRGEPGASTRSHQPPPGASPTVTCAPNGSGAFPQSPQPVAFGARSGRAHRIPAPDHARRRRPRCFARRGSPAGARHGCDVRHW